jgi:4-hydroxy-3-methylbut-2-enyl diphosphate reductase
VLFPLIKINDCETIGVSSGASAPEILVRNFLDQLNNKYQLEIKEVEIVKEDIVFNVPKKLN